MCPSCPRPDRALSVPRDPIWNKTWNYKSNLNPSKTPSASNLLALAPSGAGEMRLMRCHSILFHFELKLAVRSLIIISFCLIFRGFALSAYGWEGHKWSEWHQVSTWEKPNLQTHQTGRRVLVPLLGGDAKDSNKIVSVSDWESRRKNIAEAIQKILGQPTNLTRPKLEVIEDRTEDFEYYTRQHLKIRSETDDWIPAYLLVPKTRKESRVPAMLCLHQTVAQGKQEPCGIRGDPELAFAVELVKRGYVCLAPDAIGFGERIPPGKQPYHNSIAFYQKH